MAPFGIQNYQKTGQKQHWGEMCALSEMVDRACFLRESYEPFADLSPGALGLEDSDSPFTHSKAKRAVAEKYSARHFLSVQQFVEEGDVDNVHWLPGTGNPAGGLAKVESGVVFELRMP